MYLNLFVLLNYDVEMRYFFIVLLNVFFMDQLQAEPARIDKTALNNWALVNPVAKDGSWLQHNCEDYVFWYKNPGSLWQGNDSKAQNLSAGLCVGFVSAVVATKSLESCVDSQKSVIEKLLDYLRDHPDAMQDSAVTVIGNACD